MVEHLGVAAYSILIEVPARVGWRLPEQPRDLKFHPVKCSATTGGEHGSLLGIGQVCRKPTLLRTRTYGKEMAMLLAAHHSHILPILWRNRRRLTRRAERACIEYGEPAPRRALTDVSAAEGLAGMAGGAQRLPDMGCDCDAGA